MNPLIQLLSPVGRMLRGKRPDEALSVRHHPALAAPRTIELTSSSFPPGGVIPDRHCSMDMGPNVSPALAWTGVPPGTRQLLFILEDIDAPRSRPSLHTVALLDPSITALAEGEFTAANPAVRFVPALRGGTRYLGPRPLPGHGVHRYGFHLYALDRALPADSAPADSAPADSAPADSAPAGSAPADSAPTGSAPASPAPAGSTLAGPDDVLAAVDGHVLADGFLEGVKEA